MWGVEQSPSENDFSSCLDLEKHLQCHPVIAQILWNRRLRSSQSVERLLKPELSQLPDPFSIIDMRQAVERVALAIFQHEKIAIYGDYDVDGTCGATLLMDFLRSVGVSALIYQPNRFTDGYGVHSLAIQKLIDQGAKVVVTVDCGITAVEPARLAKSLGVDLLILDHHKVGVELPPALAVVNPQRAEDQSGLQNLCGTGLAFFFVMALRAELRRLGFFKTLPEPNLVPLLDLVAIATVADMVDIRGVNRILVKHGIRVLNKNPRIGIKALLEVSGLSFVQTHHCGFVLGPRINAAGRLKSAKSAFDLLGCRDLGEASLLARELEDINFARRQTQDKVYSGARAQALLQLQDLIWKELLEKIPAADLGPWPRALVLMPPQETLEGWHEGVLGIVATKLAQEFKRPVVILSNKEGDFTILKGSVRSISKIDILAALSAESVAKFLLNYGGHAHAGGVSLNKKSFQDFLIALNHHLAMTTTDEHFKIDQAYDAEVKLDEIDTRLVEELQWLEPFGAQFPEPILKISKIEATRVRVLKGRHLKMRFGDGHKGIDALWFNSLREGEALVSLEQVKSGVCFSYCVSPQWNEWQGQRQLQLRVHSVLE